MIIGKRYQRCRRCNRKLKTEEAQKRGYGPHCFQLQRQEARKRNKDLIDIAEEMGLMKPENGKGEI